MTGFKNDLDNNNSSIKTMESKVLGTGIANANTWSHSLKKSLKENFTFLCNAY